MSLACAHCGSHYFVEDYDPESHRTLGYRCGSCGRSKIEEEQERLSALGSQLSANNQEVPMPNQVPCATPGCTSPQWGISEKDKKPRCFKCLLKEIKDGGFVDRLVSLADKHGGVEQLALDINISRKKIRLALEGRPTNMHNVMVAVKKRFGMPMRTWLREGGPYPGIVKATLPAKETKAETELPPGEIVKSSPRPFTYVYDTDELLKPGDAVVMGDDGKLHLVPRSASSPVIAGDPSSPVIARSPQATSQSSCSASLSQEVYDMTDGFRRTATLVFSFIDGEKLFAECRYETMNKTNYDYEDWMFLGAIAAEIRRIKEGR